MANNANSSSNKVKVGIIGCGNIFGAYMTGTRVFPILEVVACADINPAAAQAKAAEFGLKAYSVEELLADPQIQLVINLTVPKVHADVSLEIINAGKHVYSEKPLAVTRDDGRRVIEGAKAKGVLVGCAPDTFLGGGLQSCRKLIEDGWIGRPVAAAAFMGSHGPESWHPNPQFFYQKGGGPLFDMGPYYLTALVSLLGPARRVTASTGKSLDERVATSKTQFGTRLPVEVSTHAAGVIDFENGAIATLTTTFDVWSHHMPWIEIYGTQGSLSTPDPNTFGGTVRLHRAGSNEWDAIPLSHPSDLQRGIGPADMAYALCYGRPHRANGEMAYHVLDIMSSFDEASESGQHVMLQSHCTQPAPLPLGLLHGTLDTN